MIIVSGCSWACGEWSRGDQNYGIIFPGLEHNFQRDGIDAINLGIPSGSNYQVAHKVAGYIDRNPEVKVDKIFIFQTAWTRDSKMIFEEDYKNIKTANDLQNIFISRFYHRLSEISQQSGAKVYLIGGVSDILWLDNMQDHYPGVEILCQSLVNFLVYNNHRVHDPVFDWYDSSTIELIKKIKLQLSDSEILNLLQMINQGLDRENLVFSHPEYFWPDGGHPNRHAYKKLYNELIKLRIN